MIRKAISCDICGTEMQHTNHWFVAYDQGAELRLSGWNARSRLRAGAKHLCGQTCLHKLVDDFMARTLFARASAAADKSATQARRPDSAAAHADTSLTSSTPRATPQCAAAFAQGCDEFESSAHLIPPMQVVAGARPSLRLAVAEPKTADAEVEADEGATPGYSSRNWRAEAWKREREREQRTAGRVASARRHSIA